MDEFKEATMIELHSSGVCIVPENFSGEGWREFSAIEGTAYSIMGEDICNIAKIFGITPSEIEERAPNGKLNYLYPEHLQFKISKIRQEVGKQTDSDDYGGMDKVKGLWARTEGASLLHIRVDRYYEDNGGDIREYTQDVTYSGSFSVWWKNAGSQ